MSTLTPAVPPRPKRRRSLGEEGRAGAKEKGKVAAGDST